MLKAINYLDEILGGTGAGTVCAVKRKHFTSRATLELF